MNALIKIDNNFARQVCSMPPSYHTSMAVIDAHRARPRFCADFESSVAGIPCGIRIDSVFIKKPDAFNDASDWDHDGYDEIDFTVLNRYGYEAPWLQKKITPSDTLRIELHILNMKADV